MSETGPFVRNVSDTALAYKEEILAGEKPVCALERVHLDLSDAGARRELGACASSRGRERPS